MSIDVVEDIEPRRQYTASVGQTDFDYPFPIFDEADVVIYQDEVLLALTTDYTVSGVGNDTGGTITFVNACDGGEVITLYRDTVLERLTDFPQNGPQRAAAYNDEFDRFTLIVQELKSAIARCLRLSPLSSASNASAEFSPLSNWLSKYVFINSNGEPEPADIVTGTLSQSTIGALLNPVTDAETAAGVTVVNKQYPELYVLRYGSNTSPGVTDMAPAIQAAINVAQRTGGEVVFSPGVYLIASQIVVTSACTLRSLGLGGPRVFANPATAYGGAEIAFSKSVSDPYDTGSFALKIDTGSVGAEGIARVRVRGLGISWQDNDAGGIYIEGAQDVGVEDCWFTGGVNNYNAGTQTGFCIYTKDAIISHFQRNTFFDAAFGIVAENYWNENDVSRNNFQNIKDTCIVLRGKTTTSLGNSISRNNFLNAKYGVQINGDTRDIDITRNTFEIITHGPVVVQTTDYLDASSNGTPANIHVEKNNFVACNGGVASSTINFNPCAGGTVIGNELHNPSGSTNSLLNVNSSSSNITVAANDPDTKPLVTGDPTKCAAIDAQLYRQQPLDSSEATKSGFGTTNSGALWWHAVKKALRLWNDARAVNILTGETISKADGAATPSVQGVSGLLCNDSTTTTITNLTSGYEGQIVTVYNQSTHNLTIQSNANFALDGSVDLVLAQNDTLTVQRLSGAWLKIGTRTP